MTVSLDIMTLTFKIYSIIRFQDFRTKHVTVLSPLLIAYLQWVDDV